MLLVPGARRSLSCEHEPGASEEDVASCINKISRSAASSGRRSTASILKGWSRAMARRRTGLGGYASGTVAGVITRRYHGILIAALAAPLGRIVMLSHVAEEVRLPGNRHIEIGGPRTHRGRA
jgi:hypothetical protein